MLDHSTMCETEQVQKGLGTAVGVPQIGAEIYNYWYDIVYNYWSYWYKVTKVFIEIPKAEGLLPQMMEARPGRFPELEKYMAWARDHPPV